MTEEPQAWKQSLERLRTTDEEYAAEKYPRSTQEVAEHIAASLTAEGAVTTIEGSTVTVAGSNPAKIENKRRFSFAPPGAISYIPDDRASGLGDYFKKALEESRVQATLAVADHLLGDSIERLEFLERELEAAHDEQAAYQIIKFRTEILEPLLERYKALNEQV